jgi:dinuclear metal center YbgI/SA1388 family protein
MNNHELAHYLDNFLQVDAYTDYAPNGLQVEGKSTIRKICTAVTASLEVVEAAARWKADALLVHHGYFWKNEALPLIGMKGKRIQALMAHDMNLYAYHLPLDCHLDLGNNAQLGRLFPLESMSPHTISRITNLLWSGQLIKAYSFNEFLSYLGTVFGKVNSVQAADHKIKRIAWCTGGAQDYIEHAAKLGVDAFISGEISERTYYQAKEMGVHYFGCGHHATEERGIQALGEHLAKQFSFEHHFINVENPY